ncbi:MAG: hypothetical protein Q8922_09575 [Bacteroidota bacterium]|nr:hypothetical protein [Bacteroidota bacterium]MDP4234441.1 hypothetical protein [Bacteroidota bacterium]MDP4243977.1 hypothetical protein [Bacteroidota bacterium]MDP4288173.1 hypothetical protein [Bacteroidota bacterium]
MAHSLNEVEQMYYTSVAVGQLKADIERLYEVSLPGSTDRARSAFLLGAALFDLNKESATYFEEAKQIAITTGDKRLLADALHGEALGLLRQGKHRIAAAIEENALKLALETDHRNRIAVSYYTLGIVSSVYGVYEETADYFGRSLQLALQGGYLRLQVNVLAKLRELFLTAGNLSKAKNYADSCLQAALTLNSEAEINRAKVHLSTVAIELQEYDRVIELLSDVMQSLPPENLPMWCAVHTLLGKVEAGNERWKEAEQQYKKALSLATYPRGGNVRANTLLILAELYLKTHQNQLALKHARLGMEEARKSEYVHVQKIALHTLHEVHKELNQYKKAYEYLEQYNALVSESDKELLKSRLEFHELRHDYEAEQVKAEQGARQAELLRIELERKERELMEKTRHLIKQREALAQFQDDLRAMMRRSSASDPLVMQVRERLKAMPELQADWEAFNAEFKSVHPDFGLNLARAHPDLTPMERKICPFIRLDLGSEDIAKLLSLSIRNIENHRYRIRKKFGLSKTDSLTQFLEKY